MTLLGKVFTGLVFLLSVIFFALSVAVNATHINQKERADSEATKARDAQQKNTELSNLLEDTKTELAIEQAARRAALASLQTQLDQQQQELESGQRELAELLAAHTVLVQTEKATAQDLKAKTDDNELLRQQLVEARQNRDDMMTRLVAAKDSYNRLQGVHQALKEREAKLASDYTKSKELMETLGLDPATLVDAPPPVNGQVLKVATNGLVEVSLGRDDGMREGFTLEAHRGSQYLGRLKVRRVAGDKSVAEIMVGYQKGYIRVGDRVDSKLF